MSDLKLVLVEWLDSRRGEGWVRLDELESSITRCRSVGWLIAKDAESVTLAGHLGENPAQCCGDVTIPRRAIQKITPACSPFLIFSLCKNKLTHYLESNSWFLWSYNGNTTDAMTSRKATLIIRYKADDGWKRAEAAHGANGRIRPGYAMVDGSPTRVGDFHYQVRFYDRRKLKYIAARRDANKAETLRRRTEHQESVKAEAVKAGVKVQVEENRKTAPAATTLTYGPGREAFTEWWAK